MSNKYTLECCVDSVESAVNAQTGGADRLELCSGLVIGGLTPSLSLFELIRETVDIKIHVLIRPRFGDFLYSGYELELMKREIRAFRSAGAQGVVIGCLKPDGSLDTEQLKQLIGCADGMSVTLHRAFDMCREPFAALEEAEKLGVNTILTSGQAPSCLKGFERMKELASAAGERVTILAGAGINEEAVKTLLSETGLTAFHMSGKEVLKSGMSYKNPAVSMGLPGLSEYELWRTGSENIRAVRRLLDHAAQYG